MLIVNTDFISNQKIETLSVVRGSTIRAKHIGKDLLSGLKHIVGGELNEYVNMINESRDIATNRMVEEAKKLSADAIINVRYTTSDVMQGAAEILVYGTAVKFF
jgi:uncharacterized protein YbjQ (UPF0145 family)